MPIQNAQPEIVVGVDGSASATAAVRWAAGDAKLRRVALRLVNVVAPISAVKSSPWIGISARADRARFMIGKVSARQILDSAYRTAADVLSPHPGFPIHTGILTGLAVPALADYTKNAAMLVVGCRGRGPVSRALFGSVSSGLVKHASCPLAVIHDDESLTRPKGPVVVGIDGSPASESALRIAYDEASRRSVDLIAMHTWSDEGPVNFGRPGHAPIEWAKLQADEEEVLAELLAGWGAQYPDVTVHRVVVSDRPVHRLLNLAERAQLLVVGSQGHNRLTEVLHHSVSSAIATTAHIPVIVTHSPHTAA